jgi:hypothetical protein
LKKILELDTDNERWRLGLTKTVTNSSSCENLLAVDSLADEFEDWYRKLSEINHAAPRAISGITSDGKQFILILKDIPWTGTEHVQRRNFIYWLLQKENIIAYVYGSLMQDQDSQKCIHIIADDGNNIVHKLMPIIIKDNKKEGYDTPTVHRAKHYEREWHPFTNLMAPDSIDVTSLNQNDLEFFDNVWKAMRSKCLWRDRRVIPSSD